MKFYPTALPYPLQNGYATTHKPNMLRTAMADGYARQRLVNQGAPDKVNCQILLNEKQYCDLLQWYKADIQSGASWFVMPLLRTEGEQSIQYKYVRIQNGEMTATLLSTSATVGTLYRVSFTLDSSNTIVDDGSWQDHYDADNGGDIIVPLQQVADAIGVDGDVDDVISGFTRIEE